MYVDTSIEPLRLVGDRCQVIFGGSVRSERRDPWGKGRRRWRAVILYALLGILKSVIGLDRWLMGLLTALTVLDS